MNVSNFFNYDEPLSTENTASVQSPPDLSLLPKWPTSSWNIFFELTQTLRFNDGDVVVNAGDNDRALYVVADGQFELILPRSAGELRIATAGIGSVIGEHAFLDSQPQKFIVRARSDGELVRFSFASYESFKARHPDLASELVWDLARIGSLRQRQIASLLAE